MTRRKVGALLAAGGILLALFLLQWLGGIGIPCPFHAVTGWYCPGCGISRMLTYAATGRWYAALRMNPLLFVLLPFLLVYGGFWLWSFATGRPNRLEQKLPSGVSIALVVVLVVYGVLRNLPAFSYLAPTVVT